MEISKFIVTEDMTVLKVMERIEDNSGKTAFVCQDGVLLGAVSDGDIRRYILGRGSLNEKIRTIANYDPVYLPLERKAEAGEMLARCSIDALPLVDSRKRIVEIVFETGAAPKSYPVIGAPFVIMAGGKGTRLKPYTDILPKPLIPVGDRTISEHIIERFERYGCAPVYMIVNYKKNFIKAYFQEAETAREIQFIEEEEFLGTGGGLRLLRGRLEQDFFMTNCDVLIEADYERIMDYHRREQCILTMVCAKKEVVIPYGTIEIGDHGLAANIMEKPRYEFQTNTGMYVISPALLDQIPENTNLLMTDIIKGCIDSGQKVGVYTIEGEAWMDMGQMEELEKMRTRLL